MTKKITTVCCTVVLLATTAATPALSQSKNFAGPSIAIGVGYNSTNYNNTLKTDNTGTDNIKTGNKNFNSLIDLSYGFEISPNFLISLGATYDLNESKNDIYSGDDGADNSANLTAKLKNHYSIYAQPTYALNNNTAVFVKAGYHYAKSEIKLTATDGTDTDSLSYSKNLNAWSYGVGAKTFLTNNAFLQFEGSLTKYDSQNKTFVGLLDTYTFNHKPEVLSALVSIGYKF